MSGNVVLDWVKRHYIWAGILAALLFVAFLLGTQWYTFDKIGNHAKQSFPGQLALAKARADSSVVAALGTPIEDGSVVLGRITGPKRDHSAESNFAVHLTGPKGSGVLTVEAEESQGIWSFNRLFLQVDGTGERIVLVRGDEPWPRR